jgi:hypothetical protein
LASNKTWSGEMKKGGNNIIRQKRAKNIVTLNLMAFI